MKGTISFITIFLLVHFILSAQVGKKEKQSTIAVAPTTYEQAPQAGYRITINGFTCNHETLDDPLERDGKHDEVYITCETQFKKSMQPPVFGNLATFQYGDINSRPLGECRIQAGSASNMGGIKTGDSYPASSPWKRNEEPLSNRLPLFIWQGIFHSSDTLTILPKIYNWDGDRKNATFGSKIILNKPIGMHKNAQGELIYGGAYLQLSFESIMLKSNSDEGLGKGIVSLYYHNIYPTGLGLIEIGTYTIYLQIEKIETSNTNTLQAEVNKQWPIIAENAPCRIINLNSQKAIDLKDNSKENEAPIIQWSFLGTTNQLWTLKQLPNGNYTIKNVSSGKYLETFGFSRANGGKVSQWDYTGAANQQWLLELQSDGSYIIRNADSRKVLDVTNLSKDNGTVIQQWDATNGANQKFYICTRNQNN